MPAKSGMKIEASLNQILDSVNLTGIVENVGGVWKNMRQSTDGVLYRVASNNVDDGKRTKGEIKIHIEANDLIDDAPFAVVSALRILIGQLARRLRSSKFMWDFDGRHYDARRMSVFEGPLFCIAMFDSCGVVIVLSYAIFKPQQETLTQHVLSPTAE